MSNIRYGALIKNAPPVVLKNSTAHFEIVSDGTADGSQDVHSSVEFLGQSFFHAGAKKRFVTTVGLEIKSNIVGIPQMNYRVSSEPIQGEFGQINYPFPNEFQYGPNGESITEKPVECAYFFCFNRWNLKGHGTLTPSTEIATYPATNTYLQQPSKVWRSTSTTASLTRNLANPYRISAVAIVYHNLSSAGTFRVRVGNDPTFTTNKYDSGTLRIWEAAFSTTGLYAEEADSEGYPTNELIELLRYCGENPRIVRWVTFTEVNAQYIKIDFEDAANERGLVEVAYVYCGLHVKIKPDQLYGWQLTPVGVSRIKKSASGSPWIDIFFRHVMIQANFASQPEPQTLAFFSLLAGMLGKNKELIVAFQPDNIPAKKLFFTAFCRFNETPQIENVGIKSYNVPISLEELTG